jgi:hypothetical protein
VPCRDSYPRLRRLNEKYGKSGVDVVLYTMGAGSWLTNGKFRKTSGDEEAELTRDYYVSHWGIRNLLAFDSARYEPDTTQAADSTGKYPDMLVWPEFSKRYKFTGFGTVAILDKRGIIRARFNEYAEEAIDAIVAKLLAETAF